MIKQTQQIIISLKEYEDLKKLQNKEVSIFRKNILFDSYGYEHKNESVSLKTDNEIFIECAREMDFLSKKNMVLIDRIIKLEEELKNEKLEKANEKNNKSSFFKKIFG